MSTFVFLHVGADAGQPTLLVRSLLRFNPGCRIIQCTDASTPAVAGVTDVRRREADTTDLIAYRLHSFADLGLAECATYLDTDMLCLRELQPELLLGDAWAAVCARSYDRDALLNTRFRGMDMREHEGRTLGAVFPYVGCFTITRGGDFWAECRTVLDSLHPQYQFWYGDQEALRQVVERDPARIACIPERQIACLPDKSPEDAKAARILHFKGAARKPMMHELAARLGLSA